uniref:Ig-like domain-containing protein n=1 Tax=Cyprinus carpio carpio TaxID=630221 RepID=A0A8C1DVJ1_CYPCA
MIHMLILFSLSCCHLIGVFGAETDETRSVMEGDSVTLHTDFTEIHEDDDIMWNFGAEKSLIALINRASGIFLTFSDERLRDRLKLDRQTGSLTIINITTEHAGLYEVEIIAAQLSSKTFIVSVFARLSVPVISSNSSQCSSSSSSSSQQNCSLLCSVVNVGHVTLSWYKGNSLLSSISVSDLSISLSLPLEVEYQDNNSYSCVINNPIINQTQQLNITQLCHTCSALDGHITSQTVSLIVLISAAVAGSLLIVAAVVIFCICRKHRKNDQEESSTGGSRRVWNCHHEMTQL